LTQSLRIWQRKVRRIYTQQRKGLWDQNQIETSFIYSECSLEQKILPFLIIASCSGM
jgi:hypothetical protein